MPELDPNSLASIFGPVREGASATYEADIAESTASDAKIVEQLTDDGISMELFDQWTGRLIRRAVNVLAVDAGGIFADGHFTMVFSAQDNPLLNKRLAEENHVVVFEFDYVVDGTTQHGKIEFVIKVIAGHRPKL